MAATQVDFDNFIGRSWDRLDLAERELLYGSCIAREIYTPQTLPLQRIEAIGDSVEACVAKLQERNLDPLNFEFVRLDPPYLTCLSHYVARRAVWLWILNRLLWDKSRMR